MALFNHEAANRAVDSSGAGVRNAVRCIYPKGSNSMAPLYRDPDLTEQQTSDMRSDENGFFGLCYLEEGEYRVVITDPDGRTVLYSADDVLVGNTTPVRSQQDYATLDALAEDGLLSYTAGNGRLKVWPGMRVRVRSTDTDFCVLPEGDGSAQVATTGGVGLCETGTRFSSEARFAAAVARGEPFSAGTTVMANGAIYVFLDDGNTLLPGLTGWRRVVSPQNETDLTDTKAKTDLVSVTQAVNLDVLPALVANSNTYDSLAAGLAGTSSGAAFFVIAGPGLQVYRNESGTGTFLGWHGEIAFETVADLIAETVGLPTGATLRARREGFRYQVAPAAATDHHLTTAGGTKLYVQPAESGRYNVKAFGAKGDGTTDDSAAIQAAVDLGKATPGVTIYFPKGAFRVVTSIDCTYAGVAGGISGGYYGFTIEGSDQINTLIKSETAGTPTWDMTGKPRMTFRNIGFANYSDGAHNPSCFLLLARNTSNGYAGGHVFDRCTFRGYVTQTGVQCASSEVNKWFNVDFEIYSATSGLELTEQIETTVNSEYIDLSGHVFSGGNTRHLFVGCAFNGSSVPSGPHYVRCSGIDNSQFIGAYCHFHNGEAAFHFSDNCSNVSFLDVRGEGPGDYFIRLGAGVTLTSLTVTGRGSSPIRGEDASAFVGARIDTSFLATGSGATSYSFDAYDATDCEISGMTNGARVRNSARGTYFRDFHTAAAWSLPTGDTTQPEEYGLAYTGGASNYRRRVESRSIYDRRELGRSHISGLVTPLNIVNPATGTQAINYNDGCAWEFKAAGALTIANPSYVNLGPDDPRGQRLTIVIVQDATGGHTVNWGNQFDLQGAAVDTAPNAQTVLDFMFISSNKGKAWCRVK
ncbi:glycosyl hydrolase family 28-related protein [Mameliella sp.]|uniref:glycosyl hydrolase family 28-related protein n=1 Tax=Mameliella sp. TaxID=1924940 RepID=UPI003B50A385